MTRRFLIPCLQAAAVAAALVLTGCQTLPDSPPVPATLRPDPLVAQQAADALTRFGTLMALPDRAAIAGMFTPEGTLQSESGPVIRGREAIEELLFRIKDVRVLEQRFEVSSAMWVQGQVVQDGRYAQEVQLPTGERLRPRGDFRAIWERQDDGRWLLASYFFAPSR